jgi:hypothetical protein
LKEEEYLNLNAYLEIGYIGVNQKEQRFTVEAWQDEKNRKSTHSFLSKIHISTAAAQLPVLPNMLAICS